MPSASGGMRTAQETVALSLSHDGWGRAAGQSWSKVLTLVGRDMESTNEPLEGAFTLPPHGTRLDLSRTKVAFQLAAACR